MTYRKGVFIVCYRKSNDKILYLLLKRKLHWKGWEFPKGGVEKKESIKKTVLRELKEETGQTAKKIKKHDYKGKYKYQKKLEDRKEIGQTFSLYSVELKKEKIKIDEREHSNYSWLTFNKAIKKLTWPNQRKCLKIVNKVINKSP